MKIAVIQFSSGSVINGVGYIMGSLIDHGHDVSFYNINTTFKNNFTNKCKNIKDFYFIILNIVNIKFDIIFLSCLSMDVQIAYKLAHMIKLIRNVPIVMGGVHPTIVKEQILIECQDIDYICIGEGEEFVIDVVNKLHCKDFNTIKNLGYRDNNTICINPIREPQNLENLPNFPFYLYHKKYLVDQNGFAFIKATRGCPYSCTFCCNSIFLKLYPGKYLRTRPIDNVISDIRILIKYNPKLICFSDEMLLTNKVYASELFKRIKTDINIPFGFMARVEYLSHDIIKLASDCGCKYIGIGIECGDEDFRKKFLNRNMSNDQIIKSFKMCHDNNIYTTSFNMIGYPVTNDNDLTESTIKLNDLIKPGYVQIAIFHPFPGTPLYEYCLEHDLIDANKMKASISCYDDSVLKNTSLIQKRNEMSSYFNTKPFYLE